MPHAKLSPSASSRWLECTASIPFNLESTSSIHADEGTFAHEMASRFLSSEENPTIGDSDGSFVLDEEMLMYVMIYVDHVLDTAKGNDVHIEERVRLFYSPGEMGTIDAYTVVDGALHVIDLKFGRGVAVHAENNSQLMIYALSLLESNKELSEQVNDVFLHIVQPRIFNEPSIWEFDLKTRNEFLDFVYSRIAESESSPVYRAGEKQCRWCQKSGDCREQQEATFREVSLDFDVVPVQAHPPLSSSLTEQEIGRILEYEDMITKFLKDVRAEALKRMQAGISIEGYKLVEGRKNRIWLDEEMAEDLLKKTLKKDAYTQKIISPTQAMKLLKSKSGKNINRLKKMVLKPKGESKVVPDKDERVEIEADFDIIEKENTNNGRQNQIGKGPDFLS